MRAFAPGFTFLAVALSVNAASITLDSGPVNVHVPDGNVNGLASTLPGVSGEFGWITDVTVTVNISGGYNGDLYAFLSHATGFSVLLNRVGRTSTDGFGYGDQGFQVTFSDAGLTDIHLYGGSGGSPVSGTWQPDARNIDPASVTLDSPRDAFLSSFDNLDPNGSWTLFIADLSTGEQSKLVSWQVDMVTVVPEPSAIALGGLGLALLGLWRWRRTS